MTKPVVLVLGPHLDAVSGVSTHLNFLFGSRLAEEFALCHFQVGSEGRNESGIGRALRLAVSPLALAGAILARGAAIVHLNTSLNARAWWRDLAYLIVAKLFGARVIYQVHGGALPQHFFGRSRLLTSLLRGALQLPDAIVVLAQIELRAYRRFVPGQYVTVIPNGIDPGPYGARRRARVEPAAPLRLVYIGRLAREKGLYETLQGLRLALGSGAAANLVIAGSGPEERGLKRLARELGMGGQVAFIGPIFGGKKARLLAESDVLVLASYAEGMPYALLEGMAAGAAVVATRVGAIPDMMVEGMHGMFVPPHNPLAIARAIRKLAGDRDLLARMSDACRRRIAASYSVDRLAQEFLGLYSGLCAGRPAKALSRS